MLKANGLSFPKDQIALIDASDIENLIVVVTLKTGQTVTIKDIEALEFVMQTKPSLFEGKRLVWPKFAWMVHNLIGHPLMQLLAMFGLYKAAFWVHDSTVPKPKGGKLV